MSGTTEIWADLLLQATVNSVNLTAPISWEVALFTSDGGLGAGFPTDEVVAGGYVRKPVTWTTVADQQAFNDATIEWTPTEQWPTVTHLGITDQLGNFILWSALGNAVAPAPPFVARIAVNNLEVNFGQVSFLPSQHAGTHTAGGSDEVTINYSQMVGTVTPHAAAHTLGGSDQVIVDYAQLVGTQPAPSPHTHLLADVTDFPDPGIANPDDALMINSLGAMAWVPRNPVYGTAVDANTPQPYTLDTNFQVFDLNAAVTQEPVTVIDLVLNRLNFVAEGVYSVSYNMQMQVNGAATIEVGFFDNGVEQTEFRQEAVVTVSQDSVAFGMTFYSSFSIGENIDVRGRVTSGTENIFVNNYTLAIARVGVVN